MDKLHKALDFTLEDTSNKVQRGIERFSKTPWSSKQDFYYDLKPLKEDSILFLVNLNTKEQIELDIIPTQVSESYSSRIIKQQVFGVARPLQFYVGGEDKTVAFNLVIHEDTYIKVPNQDSHIINKQNLSSRPSNIYDLMNTIKRLSLPVESDVIGKITPPSVYLQIGDQFAGKGHIVTNLNLAGPYRNGRYLSLSMDITFTYHEQFSTPQLDIDLNQTRVSDIVLDLVNASETNDLISDTTNLVDSNNLNYDYWVYQVFESEKLRNFLTNFSLRDGMIDPSTGLLNVKNRRIVDDYLNVNINMIGSNLTETVIGSLVYDFKGVTNPVYAPSVRVSNVNYLIDKANGVEARIKVGQAQYKVGTNNGLDDKTVEKLLILVNDFKRIAQNYVDTMSKLLGAGG